MMVYHVCKESVPRPYKELSVLKGFIKLGVKLNSECNCRREQLLFMIPTNNFLKF